ncbi:MAG TPA: 50S ribosomal protein L31e, partial [Thermoplasmata archaeon]|nr:50S ribosomal protein L31e [Thermoplasmata archaeon]
VPRTKRAPYAIKVIKKFVTRHMKPETDDGEVIKDYKIAEKEKKLWIGEDVNQLIWSRGIEKPPSKIRVRVVKSFDDGVVDVSLPET